MQRLEKEGQQAGHRIHTPAGLAYSYQASEGQQQEEESRDARGRFR